MAQALIRDAALRLFADQGPDAVSLRQIAEQAQVSPALVWHHYGSKTGLREAVDAHAAKMFDDLLDPANSEEMARELFVKGNSGSIAEVFAHSFPADSPLPAYLRRLLLSGDPAGERLFQHCYEATLAMLRMMTDKDLAAPSDDPVARAAFLGDVLSFPDWLLNLAPLHHVGLPPQDPADGPSLTVLAIVAVALGTAGFAVFARRGIPQG